MQVCPCVTENALNTKSEMKWFSAAASWQQPCNYGGQTQPAAAILQPSTFASSSSFFFICSLTNIQTEYVKIKRMCKMKVTKYWTPSLFLYFANTPCLASPQPQVSYPRAGSPTPSLIHMVELEFVGLLNNPRRIFAQLQKL